MVVMRSNKDTSDFIDNISLLNRTQPTSRMNGTKIATCPASGHRIENIHNGKVASGTVKAGGQDKPAPGTYIHWDAEGVEKIEPGEQEKIQAVSDQFNRFQMMNFNEYV